MHISKHQKQILGFKFKTNFVLILSHQSAQLQMHCWGVQLDFSDFLEGEI